MNTLIENIWVALAGLLANKLRSALTMLGISIGVGAVIVLVSLGQAVQDYIADQFLGIGTNLAFVIPSAFTGGGGSPGGGGAAGRFSVRFSSITEADAAELANPFNVPDAEAVVPLLNLSRDVVYNGLTRRTPITATLPSYFGVRNRVLGVGRFFDDQDVIGGGRVAVIGLAVLKALFPDANSALGETIRIGDVPFRVIGVLTKFGGTSFGNADDIIVIPLSTGQARLQTIRSPNGAKPITVIYMQSGSSASMDALVQETTDTLRRVHNISFRNTDDFQILTQKDLLKSFGQITNLLTIFLGVIAGISLLVGGIGIMNIMLVTVTERTREIGLRKAVGARRGDILWQFLIEATVLSVVGGAAGIGIALGGIVLIRLLVPTLDATIRLNSVLLAIGIAAAIGVFFGLYPASRAAALNPIEALRHE